MKKFVWEDEGISKVIKGQVLKEDDFTFTILTEHNENIIIGKKNLIFVRDV